MTLKRCEFEIMDNGKLNCWVHNQCLLYFYAQGLIICQVGEDEIIEELGGIDKFHAWLKAEVTPQ